MTPGRPVPLGFTQRQWLSSISHTSFRIHPAIIAGRVRREQQNYRLLSQFVGTGQVRSQFTIMP